MQYYFRIYFLIFLPLSIYSQTINVTTNADGGVGNLRQAIIDINNGSDSSNTINLEIFGNSPIVLQSDLPVIKKNTTINSTGKQPINGQGQYRLFATIMADLTINNCTLQNGAVIGGNGGGGGMGAGGGIYIDRGKTLTLTQATIINSKAQGGIGQNQQIGGGGASFSTLSKDGNETQSGGDFPAKGSEGGVFDGSIFLIGYCGGSGGSNGGGSGGGDGTGSNGVSHQGGDNGYCGGGGWSYKFCY